MKLIVNGEERAILSWREDYDMREGNKESKRFQATFESSKEGLSDSKIEDLKSKAGSGNIVVKDDEGNELFDDNGRYKALRRVINEYDDTLGIPTTTLMFEEE